MTTTMTRFGMLAALVVGVVACGGQAAPEPPYTSKVTGAALTALQVSPESADVTEHLEANLVVTAIFADGTTEDVTAEVAWSVADAGVASADAGVVVGGTPGSTTVVAALGGHQASVHVNVIRATLVAMWVDVASAAVPVGRTIHVVANGLFSDGSTRDISSSVAWTTTRDVVAVAADGTVTALSQGWTQVRAAIGNQLGGVTLQVTPAVLDAIEVRGTTANVAVGDTVGLTALGTYSDGTSADVTDQVAWSSGDLTLASVRARGQGASLQAIAAGTVTITAAAPASPEVAGSLVVVVR